jgi:hypothetical protein
MTEAEWLECIEPEKLLLFIRDKVSQRKMRLFAIVCCRLIWDRITDPRCRDAVELADRFVEVGLARRRGRPAVEKAAIQACQEADTAAYHARACPDYADRMIEGNAFHAALATVEGSAWFAAHLASGFAANAVGTAWLRDNQPGPFVWDPAALRVEYQKQIPLFRDIFGNPFQPVIVDPSWLAWQKGTVVQLAKAIYDDRTFEHMPVLADALNDAGCTDGTIFDHCRGPGPHTRGSWLIDALLGKS